MSVDISPETAQEIIRLSPNLIYLFDVNQGKNIYVNGRIFETYGYSPDEIRQGGDQFLASLFHPGDFELIAKNLEKMKNLKLGEFDQIEYRLKDRSGHWRWVQDTITLLKSAASESHIIIGFASDIDNYKTTQAELKKAFETLNLSLSTFDLGLWEWAEDFSEFTWDDRMYSLHDLERIPHETLSSLSERLQKIMEPQEVMRLLDLYQKSVEKKSDIQAQYSLTTSNGKKRHIRLRGRLEKTQESNRFFGVAWDETEEISSQQMLLEQEAKMMASAKMAALGEMSAGIAHEINNPLTVIQARSFQLNQLADANKLDAEKLKAISDSISKTADKIAKIVKSLRTFARDGSMDPFNFVPLKDLIENTLEFCRTRFYNHGVELQIHQISDEIEIECRTIQIEQVLLNLLNNSFDAIQGLNEKWIRIEVQAQESHVDILVIDSGKGIPHEVVDKMMLPFFTTKEVGKGTGLGLSISSGILKNHNGDLFYKEAKGHTCFVIRLPYFQSEL